MTDFLDELVGELGLSGDGSGLPEGAKNGLLSAARTVAHNTQRKNAPLVTYVLGRYVEARRADGADGAEALADAIRITNEVLARRGDGGGDEGGAS